MTATLQVSQLLLPLSSNSKHPIIPERRTHKLSSSLCPLPHHLESFPRVHNFSGVWRARSIEIVKAVAGASATMGAQTLSGRFAELKKSGEVALIPFVVAGDPDLATTEAVLLALDANGADIIELGVPYSDPLADGPVIQAAAARALTKGTDLASVLALVAKVTPKLKAPLVLFTYYNPIMKRGPANFFRIVKEAGVAGLSVVVGLAIEHSQYVLLMMTTVYRIGVGTPESIQRCTDRGQTNGGLVVPDIPLEESGPLRELGSQYGLELVLLTTPTTPVERMKIIAQATQGFLYLVSLTGVTGAKAAVEGRVEQLLADIKKSTDKPVAVGFGISEPAHAFQVASWGADGVIVGSALVRLLFEAPSPEAGVEGVVKLIRELKEAISKKALNR